MVKLSVLLMIVGGLVSAVFLFLPLLAPNNSLSNAVLSPLLCSEGETYFSEAAQTVTFSRSSTLSLHAYCISDTGSQRDVSPRQVAIGAIFGLVPFIVGLTLLSVIVALTRVSHFWRIGMQMQAAQRAADAGLHIGVYGAALGVPDDQREED
jgi:hypothetical protein